MLWLIEKYTGRWTYKDGKWWREWMSYHYDPDTGAQILDYFKP
jgi:hypothetical protein